MITDEGQNLSGLNQSVDVTLEQTIAYQSPYWANLGKKGRLMVYLILWWGK